MQHAVQLLIPLLLWSQHGVAARRSLSAAEVLNTPDQQANPAPGKYFVVALSQLGAAGPCQLSLAPGGFKCTRVKDQAADIREWVEHHRRLGASKVYLWDHMSMIPMNSTIMDYINSGLVHYIYLASSSKKISRRIPQRYIYDSCLQRWGKQHTWMGFLDADEFLIIRNRTFTSMPALLQNYEEYGGLAVNWVMFGSSGHQTRPKYGALGSFWRCMNWGSVHSRHIKTIANTQYTLFSHGAHHMGMRAGKFCVNELGQPVEGPITPEHHHQHVVIHHYVLKSLEEYQSKMARGAADGTRKPPKFYVNLDKQMKFNCTDAWDLGYVDPLYADPPSPADPSALQPAPQS